MLLPFISTIIFIIIVLSIVFWKLIYEYEFYFEDDSEYEPYKHHKHVDNYDAYVPNNYNYDTTDPKKNCDLSIQPQFYPLGCDIDYDEIFNI